MPKNLCTARLQNAKKTPKKIGMYKYMAVYFNHE
jgi:hypothetical protein